MSIIRTRKKSRPFTQVDTATITDSRLSFRARGLHTYLMSKTDGWCVHLKQLAKQSEKEGLTAITAAMDELIAMGYATRERSRDEKGHLHGWITEVLEYPDIGNSTPSPRSGFPISVEPNSDNPIYSLYMKEDNIGFTPPIVPQDDSGLGLVAEIRESYGLGPLEDDPSFHPDNLTIPFPRNVVGTAEMVMKGREVIAASRPGENIVSKGETLLGEAEGANNPPQPLLTNLGREAALTSPSSNPPKKKGARNIDDEAHEVLRYLNAVAGKHLRETGLITARLNDGRTVEECKLVIDWILATWSKPFIERHLNQKSPFSPVNFDKNLDQATRWDGKHQRPIPPPLPAASPAPAAVSESRADRLARMNASLQERNPHAPR